jgi:hypothetical protein
VAIDGLLVGDRNAFSLYGEHESVAAQTKDPRAICNRTKGVFPYEDGAKVLDFPYERSSGSSAARRYQPSAIGH